MYLYVLKTFKIVIVKLCEPLIIRVMKVSPRGNGYLKNSAFPDLSSSYNGFCEVTWSCACGCWCFRAVALVLKLVEKPLWHCVCKLLSPDWWLISQAWGPAPKLLSFCKELALLFLPVHSASTSVENSSRLAWLFSIAKHSLLFACQQQLLLLVSTGTLC